MPVDSRTHQPFGLLHGGTSVGTGGNRWARFAGCLCSEGEQRVVGLEVNANHIRSVRAVAGSEASVNALHVGSRHQVWQTEIFDERGACAALFAPDHGGSLR